jgi:hypothetical protein
MNPEYHIVAFLRPGSKIGAEEIRVLCTEALVGFPFQVELDLDDDGESWKELLDEEGRAEMESSGITDLDLLSQDMLLTLDGYPLLIAISEGEEVFELASAYGDEDTLSEDERWILTTAHRCIELFSEEPDKGAKYKAAIDAITEAMQSQWNAVVFADEED